MSTTCCICYFYVSSLTHRLAAAVARDKVANVLLASKGRATGGAAHTAQGLARSIARELLGPLLETACSRLASLLRHAFDIAAESQAILQGHQLHALHVLSLCLLDLAEDCLKSEFNCSLDSA